MSNAFPVRRLALIVAMLLLVVPATAAGSGVTVLQDCADEELSRSYSQAEYKSALANIPADLDEYTDCRAIIRKAQLAHASGTSKKKAADAGTPKRKLSKTKRDKLNRKLQRAASSEEPVRIGTGFVQPGSFNSSSSIPTPLIVVLVLTLLGALGASAIAIRRIVISRRNR